MVKIMPFDSFILARKSIVKKIVVVGGCFDIFHYGHLTYLKKAKEQGDLLVVMLEPDETLIAKGKQPPVHNQHERAEILAAIDEVDYVILLDQLKSDQDYMMAIKSLKPSVIAITQGDKQEENKKRQAETVGGKVIVVTPLIKKFSSTKIKNHATISSN